MFSPIGWHSKKGEEGEYGEKSEHGKKGGDKKYKKWGHKKGDWKIKFILIKPIDLRMECLNYACDNWLFWMEITWSVIENE